MTRFPRPVDRVTLPTRVDHVTRAAFQGLRKGTNQQLATPRKFTNKRSGDQRATIFRTHLHQLGVLDPPAFPSRFLDFLQFFVFFWLFLLSKNWQNFQVHPVYNAVYALSRLREVQCEAREVWVHCTCRHYFVGEGFCPSFIITLFLYSVADHVPGCCGATSLRGQSCMNCLLWQRMRSAQSGYSDDTLWPHVCRCSTLCLLGSGVVLCLSCDGFS